MTKASTKRRARQAPPTWPEAFLKWYRKTGNVTYSAEKAGTDRTNVFYRRQSHPDFDFACTEALASYVEMLEMEADRRASKGVTRAVFYKGNKIAVMREYSDVLLMFRLKGCKPETYRENFKLEHSGPDSGPIQIHSIEAVEPPPAAEIDEASM